MFLASAKFYIPRVKDNLFNTTIALEIKYQIMSVQLQQNLQLLNTERDWVNNFSHPSNK